MLSGRSDVEVVGEAVNGREAVELCRVLRPDLVLMDIEMPEMDGLRATREIKAAYPDTSVLVLTSHDDPDYLLEAVRAGAAGFVLKESAFVRIVAAVQSVIDGEHSLDPLLTVQLLNRLPERSHPPRELSPEDADRRERTLRTLTGRELQILGLVTLGKTNADISETLFLSVGTVKTHVHHLIKKLGVSDRTQAAVLGIQLSLTP